MKALFGIAILPLICLGVMILTAAVVIFALKQGTQTVSKQIQENTTRIEDSSPANTRWAREDLKGALQPKKTGNTMKTCPACGGENEAGSSTCVYCGREL